MKLSKKTSLNFNDVNLLAVHPTIVKSRDEIEFEANRIIAAPMSAIMSPLFIQRAVQLGLSVPIHRFNAIDVQHDLLKLAIEQKNLFKSKSILWLCVSLHDFKQRIEKNLNLLEVNQVGILIDVANGFHNEMKKCIESISKYNLPNLFTGNIHTFQGWEFLETLGSKFIRAGIGNGAACTTTNNTGIGRGQITIIDEIWTEGNFRTAELVSDGGIKEVGDICKAFGAGADYVMIGSMFSYAEEAACNLYGNGNFYGGASKHAKELMGLKIKNIEGKEVVVDKSKIRSLETIVNEITDGVKSCISYCGYKTLKDFIGYGIFERKN